MSEVTQLLRPLLGVSLAFAIVAAATSSRGEERGEETRPVNLNLQPLPNAGPLLNQFPEFVQPLRPTRQFGTAAVVDDADPTISVRSWRYSYHARGVIVSENRLRGDQTAMVVVHPWGIDDGQGWKSPQPAGVAFFCTPEKNAIYHRHVSQVLNPFLKRMRGSVREVIYSLPGAGDAIRKQRYRSLSNSPSKLGQLEGQRLLTAALAKYDYTAQGPPESFALSTRTPLIDYFLKFPALDAGPHYNGDGFWQLPIPVVQGIDVAQSDIVAYDGEGYERLRDFLKKQGVRHILLTGYATDMCVCSTMAGYENLRGDFNVFLVGDATLATFPASDTPKYATQAAITSASLKVMITEVEGVRGGRMTND